MICVRIWRRVESVSGEGNGNPLQYSCLENSRDGGAWWAAIYGVAQSRTRLKRLSSSSRNCVSSYNYNSNISWVFQDDLTRKCVYIQQVFIEHLLCVRYFF